MGTPPVLWSCELTIIPLGDGDNVEVVNGLPRPQVAEVADDLVRI